jgi:hypothetical protein
MRIVAFVAKLQNGTQKKKNEILHHEARCVRAFVFLFWGA